MKNTVTLLTALLVAPLAALHAAYTGRLAYAETINTMDTRTK